MTADDSGLVPRSELRASHADRDAVVERLRDAAAEGRIDISELDDRLAQALNAKTLAELTPLTADLPSVGGTASGKPLVLNGGLHGAKRTGPWRVPPHITAHGGLAGVKLDFTQVDCRLPEVTVEAHGEMAGVVIVIPTSWAVDTDGISGVKDKTTPDRLPGTPLIHLTGTAGLAGVVVRHPNLRERRKLKRAELGR
ncbi:MAG TPA: DUF1707 domain-containing protein [Kribbella sp.]|uniref:DUF1707 SHOCT-like domain-containing protein n=1 Tax=Kribbella sp. TaxID=1871183 RepID=UPI002D785188|nr:DUF1707 domain-containing protein [Kribbella sp.]HET6297448.1 DUF1707 domain-containing protein [Kribbella sp.]